MTASLITPATHGGDAIDRLGETVAAVKRAANSLDDLVCHPSTRGNDATRHSTLVGSSPAWHAEAAYLVLDLGRLARELERQLRDRVTGTSLNRGSSNANTFLALGAVLELAHAVDEEVVVDTEYRLARWLHRGRTCLGEVEPLSRLPRLPGQSEPRCPWCGFTTLRYQPYAGIVRCVNPNCLDDDERRPVGDVTLGPYSGEPILAWRDGSTGLGAAA